MAISAEKTSWRWQLERLQQQLGEWIEVKSRSDDRDLNLDVFPPWLAPLLVRLTWLILAGLSIWFGYRIVYPFWREWLVNRQSDVELDRAPVQTYTVAELLARSRQFQHDRDYTQASRWLYLAMLQLLNDAKIVPHQASRTDREYLKLLGTLPSIEIGEVLVSTHERLHFGDVPITAADFDRCQQAYHQLEAWLGSSLHDRPPASASKQ
jgi:hypothetical protein